jgi:hypothetical protein
MRATLMYGDVTSGWKTLAAGSVLVHNVRVGAKKSSCATSAKFGARLLSDQLSDYGVDDPCIQAHLHGPSSRLVLDLDDSPTVLRDEEVDGPVSVVVSFPCVLHCSRPGISPWRAA